MKLENTFKKEFKKCQTWWH